jgi:hypothetical protein
MKTTEERCFDPVLGNIIMIMTMTSERDYYIQEGSIPPP